MTHHDFYLLLPLQKMMGVKGLPWDQYTPLSAESHMELAANPGLPCGQERSAGMDKQQKVLMMDQCPMEEDKKSGT